MKTLIVGQGLAGSLLAWELLQRGEQVMVVDDDHSCSSSMAAAGLINPVTGMRLVKHPLVDGFLAEAEACYRSLERELNTPLLHWIPLWRIARSEKDRQRHRHRLKNEAYKDYLGRWQSTAPHPAVNAPNGGFLQQHTGYLAPRRLLARLKQRFQDMGMLCSSRIDAKDLRLEESHVSLAGLSVDRVVFCEGFRGARNPWFDWLPFQAVKGEILTLRSETELPNLIVNGGRWVLPLETGRFKLGATYDRERLDCTPTHSAREDLLAELPALLRLDGRPHVEAHRAGVRPSTRDKAPFLGQHPSHPRVAIFNGFGSKGSLMIPWYARRFAGFLCGQEMLPEEADIRRFWSRRG